MVLCPETRFAYVVFASAEAREAAVHRGGAAFEGGGRATVARPKRHTPAPRMPSASEVSAGALTQVDLTGTEDRSVVVCGLGPATTTAALRAHFAGVEITRVVLSPTNGYAYLVLSGDRAAALGMNGSTLDGATVQVGVPRSPHADTES